MRRVGKAVGLESDVIRLVAGERPLDAMRRVRDAQLAPGDRLRVALVGGPHTPCGPCLHQWVRAIQVNGADVRIGGRDGRWLTNDAFDHITTAVVGPDRRARIVVTLHSTETAHNLQLPWGRVEPRRGGSATDVVPKKLGKCLALARARNRRRDRDGGGPHHVDLLDARPDDATIGHRGGPTQGELDHRQRQGFGFRYDYFGARQITLQFANVQPDVEYLFGLSKLGIEEAFSRTTTTSTRTGATGSATRAAGALCLRELARLDVRLQRRRLRPAATTPFAPSGRSRRRSRPRGRNNAGVSRDFPLATWTAATRSVPSFPPRPTRYLAYRHTRLQANRRRQRLRAPRAASRFKMQFVGGNFTLKKNGPALVAACKADDVEAARGCLGRCPYAIHFKDDDGLTPLHVAAAHDSKKCVVALVDSAPAVPARDALRRHGTPYRGAPRRPASLGHAHRVARLRARRPEHVGRDAAAFGGVERLDRDGQILIGAGARTKHCGTT